MKKILYITLTIFISPCLEMWKLKREAIILIQI